MKKENKHECSSVQKFTAYESYLKVFSNGNRWYVRTDGCLPQINFCPICGEKAPVTIEETAQNIKLIG